MKAIHHFILFLLSALSAGACLKAQLNRSTSLGEPIRNIPVEDVPVHGSLAVVTFVAENGYTTDMKGELLAVDEQHIWLLWGGGKAPFPPSRYREFEIGEQLILITRTAQGMRRKVSGELHAVDETHVHILLSNGKTIRIPRKGIAAVYLPKAKAVPIPRAKVTAVELVELFPSRATATGVWTTVGTLSSAFHGYGAAFSAPAWLLFGIPATVVVALSNDLTVKPEDIVHLYQFARYPQGMPQKSVPETNEEN